MLPRAALTDWKALIVEARIKPGDVVLTQSTGGVSTESTSEKFERLKTLGADHLINYKETADWGQAAAALTGRRGANVVVEVGGAGTMGQSLQAIRVGGYISLISALEVTGALPVIDSGFSLDTIAEAFAHRAAHKHLGNIYLKF